MNNRRKEYRRKIERRAPKEGVTIRHDDNIKVLPKRILWRYVKPDEPRVGLGAYLNLPSDEQQGDKK